MSAKRLSCCVAIATAAAFSATSCLAAPPLLVTFKNLTGRGNGQIYVGFVGSGLVATNAQTGAALQASQYQSEHWYTLNTLPAGVKLTSFTGGRIYVGFGTPWHFQYAGYEPSPSNPNSPDYYDRYDKVELTYTGAPADVADTTSIDYFSIPVTLNAYSGGASGKLVASVTGNATNTIVAALNKVTTPLKGAEVRTGSGAFVRVIGPGQYPPPPGLPASPYDNFDSYVTYLAKTYGPAHGNVVATVKGHFAGVGSSPTTPQTKPQDYDFTVAVDAGLNVTMTGSATVVGAHTLKITKASLLAPTGIYGANPDYSLDGAAPVNPTNDIYGWIIGDLLAGLNIGAVGSNTVVSGTAVGQMDSQTWFTLTQFFASLQPGKKTYYNQWAAALAPLSQAYNFAYSDRFAHVVATLNPGSPSYVDTLQVVFLGDKKPAK
jgi:hypothetical protein